MTREEIYALAESTNDAYSWDHYGEVEWRSIIRRLDKIGYNSKEIEAILRSKHTRLSTWSHSGYRSTAKKFMEYYGKIRIDWSEEVNALVEGTFGMWENNGG